jgi:hypothetical protein
MRPIEQGEFTGVRWVEEPLVLAVEILAPTTRLVDQLVKRRVYEEAGVDAYWMVDPDQAVLTVLELEDGLYQERAVVQGDEVFEARRPFRCRLCPVSSSVEEGDQLGLLGEVLGADYVRGADVVEGGGDVGQRDVHQFGPGDSVDGQLEGVGGF